MTSHNSISDTNHQSSPHAKQHTTKINLKLIWYPSVYQKTFVRYIALEIHTTSAHKTTASDCWFSYFVLFSTIFYDIKQCMATCCWATLNPVTLFFIMAIKKDLFENAMDNWLRWYYLFLLTVPASLRGLRSLSHYLHQPGGELWYCCRTFNARLYYAKTEIRLKGVMLRVRIRTMKSNRFFFLCYFRLSCRVGSAGIGRSCFRLLPFMVFMWKFSTFLYNYHL